MGRILRLVAVSAVVVVGFTPSLPRHQSSTRLPVASFSDGSSSDFAQRVDNQPTQRAPFFSPSASPQSPNSSQSSYVSYTPPLSPSSPPIPVSSSTNDGESTLPSTDFFPSSPEPYTVSFSASIPSGLHVVDSSYTSYPLLLDVTTLELYDGRQANSANANAYARGDDEPLLGRLTRDLSQDLSNVITETSGIFVASVAPNSPAAQAGIRVGDVLLSSSATVGSATWPKSSIASLRTSLMSRYKMSGDVAVVFRRPEVEAERTAIVEEYELLLNRPIGLQLTQVYSSEGSNLGVAISQVTPNNVNTALLESVEVGDRVVSVEAAFGGKFWPHSTVDGVVSAVNGRLPGQTVRIRFARRINVGEYDKKDASSLDETVKSFKRMKESEVGGVAPTGSNTHKLLLSRSREIVKSYTTSHTPNADSSTYSLPSRACDSVLTVLAEADAQLDSDTLATIMSGYLLTRSWRPALRAFEAATGLDAKGRKDPKLRTHVWYGKDGLTHRITPNTYALTLRTGTCLLRAHALAGDFKSSVRALRMLLGWEENGGIKVDSYAWNVALSAARTEEDYRGAMKLYETIPVDMKTQATYNTMLSLHARHGGYEAAEDLFKSMKLAQRVDKISITAIMKARVARRDFEGAKEAFDKAAKIGPKDVRLYNTLLLGLVKNNEWEAVYDTTSSMADDGVEPDAITYSYVMSGLLSSKKYAECLSVFEAAMSVNNNATRSVGLFTTAITAAARTRQFDRAMGLVGKMKMEGLKPNVKTLTSLINACTASGRGDVALEVWKSGLASNPKVDGRARLAVLRAMTKQREWDDALILLSDGGDGNDKAIFTGRELMEGYDELMFSEIAAGEYMRATETLEQFLGRGFIPSNAIMFTFIRAMNVANRDGVTLDGVRFAFGLVDRLMCRKIQISGSLYSFLLHRLVDLGELEREMKGDSDRDVTLRQIGRMLVEARTRDTALISMSSGSAGAVCVAEGWVDILSNSEVVDEIVRREALTPALLVRVNGEERSKVGAAEMRVQRYGRRRRARV